MQNFYTQVRRLVMLSLTILFTSNLIGQTNTWDGSNSNSWNTAANWSLNLVPTAAHDVVININATIDVDVTPPNLRSLTINTNSAVSFTSTGANRTLTITNAATGLLITTGSTLTLYGSNAGGGRSMNIAFSAANAASTIAGGLTLTATGAGTSYNATSSNTVVSGTLTNNGGIITSTSANLNFAAGGTYVHGYNGGIVPTATWNLTSNCTVTGITSIAPTGLAQSFGNFSWNCAGHTATINLLGTLTTINGNFTINQAGNPGGTRVTDPLVLTQNLNTTLTVGGHFTLSNTGVAVWFALTNGTALVTMNVAGDFNMSNATTFFDYVIGASMNSHIVNVTGNLNISGGLFDWTFIPTAGSLFAQLNLTGNFNLSGTGAMTTSVASTTIPNGKLKFVKAGTQTISVSNAANLVYTNFEVSSGTTVELLSSFNLTSQAAPYSVKGGKFEVLTGGIVDMNTFQLLSSSGAAAGSANSFNLNAGAGIITANTNGIQNTTVGSVSASIATRTYSSAANYTYDGVAVQNSGIFTTSPTANQVANLTINNTAGAGTTGVTLQQPIAVSGNCAFNSGILTATTTNLLTINDNATTTVLTTTVANTSFCDGPMKKIGNDAFTFHVGDRLGGYRYCGITAPLNVTDAFTAEFIRAPASAAPRNTINSTDLPPLQGVSRCEYWTIDRTAGTSDVGVTLTWNSLSPCNAIAYVINPFVIVVAHFNGTSWNRHGRTTTIAGAGFGEVTWTGLTGGFNTANTPFSLGSTNLMESPLPVKLTVNVTAAQDGNKIEWTNYTEDAVTGYEIQRSADGRSFTTISNQNALLNNAGKADYTSTDAASYSSVTYYRIKIIEMSGNVSYSSIVKVQRGPGIEDGILVYPNPVISKNFTLEITKPAGDYKITLFNSFGQAMMNAQWQHQGGSASRTFELASFIKPGIYYLQVIGNNLAQQTKISIQ
jgi:hypothetical protein